MYSIKFGEVPGYPGYEQWLVYFGDAYVTDFGKREDAEAFIAARR